MKPRRWVFVVCACVLALAIVVYEGVKLVEKNRDIERILINSLSTSTGGEFSVGRVRLGFFSVYLQDVRASLSTHSYNASVHDIKVAFSIVKLISTRGDFGKSISKIILISPAIDIHLAPKPSPEAAGRAVEIGQLVSLFRNFPVRYLLVRRGTVSLSRGGGKAVVLGEELAGRLRDEEHAITMELRGKMASNKKNLFLSAAYSKTGEKHRVSLRLDKARVTKPISLGMVGITVTAGTLDGVFELSFPDSVTRSTFESNGWLHYTGGTCTVPGVKNPLTSITLLMTLTNTTIRIDSMKCEEEGIVCSGAGIWDLAAFDSSGNRMTVRASGIRPEKLAFFPPSFLRYLSGAGWAETKIFTKKKSPDIRFTCSAGGLTAFDLALMDVSASGWFDKTKCTVDTLTIRGPGLMVSASAVANFGKQPVAYSVTAKGSVDTAVFVPALSGRIMLQGTASGLGEKYFVDATIGGTSLSYNGIHLGSPALRVTTAEGKGISFVSSGANNQYFSIDGIVDNFADTTPRVACRAVAGSRLIKECIARAFPGLAPVVDSAWAGMVFKGTAGAFSAKGQAGIAIRPPKGAPPVCGGVDFVLDKADHDRVVRWQVAQRDLMVSDSIVPLRAHGIFCADSFRCDSISLLKGVRGGGIVRFGKAAAIDMTIKYRDVPLAQLSALLPGARLLLSTGTLSGTTRVSGPLERVRTDSELHLRGCAVGVIKGLETDAVVQTRDTIFTVLPLLLRQNGVALLKVDTVSNSNGLRFSGSVRDLDAASFLGKVLPEDFMEEGRDIRGTFSGSFTSSLSGAAADVELHSDRLAIDTWGLDRIQASLIIDGTGITVRSFSAEDSLRVRCDASGRVPWSVIANEENDSDTLDARFIVTGDLIASLEHNASIPFYLPVAGHGQGTVEVAVKGTPGNLRVTKAVAQIQRGVISAKPYVPDDIKDFSLRMTLDRMVADTGAPDDEENGMSKAQITTVLAGTIGRRPVSIRSTHAVPDGFEPITFGFLDLGVLLLTTPKRGIDIHIPGLMGVGAPADVEFVGKAPFPEFALSGPVDRLCISGAMIMRTCDITFPPIENIETHVKFDPFPYINWNLDLQVGNRKVMYYYDTGKNRKLMRFVECSIDPVSTLSLRGRDLDKTFKLLGALRSTKGSIFFARTFDRNVDIGLDFVPELLPGKKGYNNLPFIWGSAEALSDTNRFERIKLTLITRDSVSGAWSERGRFYDIHFRVGSEIEQIPGESEKKFISDEGKRYGSLGGAGEFVSAMGEQYLHRIFLQNLERRLAKTLGLDVINVETSIASNYFNKLYNRQFDLNKWDYLTFANVGITLGRYILYDKVFLKWRTELVPVDTLLRPEYNLGFEFQPMQYFLMDFNYGVRVMDKTLETNPQVNLRLQLPIKNMRKLFDF